MAASVRRIKLGTQGLEVSAQGLGCMGMSAFYGPPKSEEEMIPLIHHAINCGITFLDTSDVYGPHTNEILIGKVIYLLPISISGLFSFFLLFLYKVSISIFRVYANLGVFYIIFC